MNKKTWRQINLKLPPEQFSIIRKAACGEGKSLAEFMTDRALDYIDGQDPSVGARYLGCVMGPTGYEAPAPAASPTPRETWKMKCPHGVDTLVTCPSCIHEMTEQLRGASPTPHVCSDYCGQGGHSDPPCKHCSGRGGQWNFGTWVPCRCSPSSTGPRQPGASPTGDARPCQHTIRRERDRCRHGLYFGSTCDECIAECAGCRAMYGLPPAPPAETTNEKEPSDG